MRAVRVVRIVIRRDVRAVRVVRAMTVVRIVIKRDVRAVRSRDYSRPRGDWVVLMVPPSSVDTGQCRRLGDEIQLSIQSIRGHLYYYKLLFKCLF